MGKSNIYLLLLASIVVTSQSLQADSNGTQAYFISPNAMSRQREVHSAMEAIKNKLVLEKTTHLHTNINYTIENITLQAEYLDSKQKVLIIRDNQIQVSGGRIQFSYEFNWRRSGSQPKNGTARGSVTSQSVNYTKGIAISEQHGGHPFWKLMSNVTDLTITNRFGLKRFQPFDETDHNAISDMLDRALNITPSTIKHQILDHWNSAFQYALNQSLNSEVIGENIQYSFDHPVHQKMNMTVAHQNYGFGVDQQNGVKFIFLTKIDGWAAPICEGKTIPLSHLSWDLYGGTQNLHMICLYQEVLEYLQAKGWLNIILDTTWDVPAFQFYAGDLFDMISNLYEKVLPREILKGQCKATKDKLKISADNSVAANCLLVEITYECNVDTQTQERKNVTVLTFKANAKIQVLLKAGKSSLDFSIVNSEVSSLSFQQAGEYNVSNVPLAMFKATQVLAKLKGTKVFGTGFPTLHHEFPSTQIQKSAGYVIYADASHSGAPKLAQK